MNNTESSFLLSATNVWIGGKRNSYGIYEWITSKGETRGMNYTRWAPYEPTMYGGQKCVDLWRKHEYKWDDTHCASEFNFICKIYSWQLSCCNSWSFHCKWINVLGLWYILDKVCTTTACIQFFWPNVCEIKIRVTYS